MNLQISGLMALTLLVGACTSGDEVAPYQVPAELSVAKLPAVSDPNFCQAIQQFLSSTEMLSNNTVFLKGQDYLESKTSINPLNSYQYVTQADGMPVVISCKIKGSAYLRAEYGEGAAGEQRFCPAATAVIINQVVGRLAAAGDAEAAARAAALVIDNNPPVAMGSQYTADFDLSYTDAEGRVHVQSPGLFQDYDSWSTIILPDAFVGPVYCHLPSHEYITALATGATQPGLLISMTN